MIGIPCLYCLRSFRSFPKPKNLLCLPRAAYPNFLAGIANGIFMADGVSKEDVEVLVSTFEGQSIDFFGALRALVYDDKVRDFILDVGYESLGPRLVNPRKGEEVVFEPPAMTLEVLLAYGKEIENEQENIKRIQLADAYLDGAVLAGSDGSSNTDKSLNQ